MGEVAVVANVPHDVPHDMPRQAEGAILYEALVDPDLRLTLQRKAERERDRWKAMYKGIAIEYDLPRAELADEEAKG